MAELEQNKTSEELKEISPEKQVMIYFIACYIGAILLAIICVSWKLKGYNKSEAKLHEVIKTIAKKEKYRVRPRAIPRERDPDVPGVRRRGARDRIQQQAQRQQQASQDSNEVDEDRPKEKIGAKKQRKLQDKEEKRIRREADELERVERRKAQEEREQILKQEEENKKLEEEKQAEIEKKAEEERARIEEEEYQKMREEFDIEEEGEKEQNEEENKNLLQEFIDYVKKTKVVLLEDLASHFGLRTQEAIDRIQELLKNGNLTGVIDDRGKFIYLSTEELQAVAEYVKRQGRISIAELARASNSLINLKSENELEIS